MAFRLVVPIEAAAAKGDELIAAFHARSQEVRKEAGCEEFELYQSTERPDHFVLLERWTDETTLKAHAELNLKRGNTAVSLRVGMTPAERYIICD